MQDNKTEVLVYGICTSYVSTKTKYKGVRGVQDWRYEQRKIFLSIILPSEFQPRYYNQVHVDIPDWSIKDEKDATAQDFWKYLFVKHHQEIARIKDCKPSDFPEGWKLITIDMAKENLKNLVI